MVKKTISVEKEFGADIIPYLVQSACHYESMLYIADSNKKINMKSIMGMTILQLNKGTSFELIAEGADEQKAIDEISGCFE
ncbi:MAG TPA: HPr family phosphocarrier protein [Lachnospiraceae bacterium]|nr:HPr family phosphocarrier protein [Lachnospiraceae bacterium]